MKKALITGITGQDGSYLAEFLLKKGYEVHGICRRKSAGDLPAPIDNVQYHWGEITETAVLIRFIGRIEPDEVYNLAAQSNVFTSFKIPSYTTEVNGLAVVRLVDALALMKSGARFYQASSSEMFGKTQGLMQSEVTPLNPQSPYAYSKVLAHHAVCAAREAYGLFACNGILFNHESPRRPEQFVTRKITKAVRAIYQGKQSVLTLGNLNAKRDWGYAPEYVEAMWLMLQQETPDDYVIATGETHTVEEFAKEAFALVDLDYKKYVRQHEAYLRPAEVDVLCGDASKAKRVLGWEPKTRFKELVRLMVSQELV